MEIWNLLITEKFLFWTFSRCAIRSFFEPKSWWRMIFTNYWKVLVLNCFKMGNTIFFWTKKLMKDDIYWLLKSSYFELFVDGKCSLFLSQKIDGKMIFTWSFWAFHDIPGLGKYGFSCSVVIKFLAQILTIIFG